MATGNILSSGRQLCQVAIVTTFKEIYIQAVGTVRAVSAPPRAVHHAVWTPPLGLILKK